jgi:hypothetical protein
MLMRLIGLVLVIILSVPLAAEAQQAGKIAKVGTLGPPITDDPEYRKLWEAFTGGLRDYGWIENQNVVFERRTPGEGPERYSRPAAELVALQPDIIVTGQASRQFWRSEKLRRPFRSSCWSPQIQSAPASSQHLHDRAGT